MILQALKRGRVNFSYLIVIHVWTDALNRIKYIAAWSYVLISEITPLQANLISIRYLYAEIIFPYDMGKLGKSFWIVPKYDELLNYVVSFDYDNSHFLSLSLSLPPPTHTFSFSLIFCACYIHTFKHEIINISGVQTKATTHLYSRGAIDFIVCTCASLMHYEDYANYEDAPLWSALSSLSFDPMLSAFLRHYS